MATWPTSLPKPLAGGYGINPVDQTVRTDMEAGAARQRRRTSARNDHIDVSWLLTDAMLTIFRTWFENPVEAAGGAAWFNTNLALGTGGIVAVEARFIGPPKVIGPNSRKWVVSAKLEVR